MPITTPQGTLDFKKVDRVTFVGASSNTVIDTTTGSVGVGVGVGGPTSNLHVVGNTRLEGDINMLHTSNTASIKLNSNVVTEFPRSKKLIKYPRVALTSGQSGLSGGYTQDGYTVEASSELTESGVLFAASNAFNSIQAYQSTDYAWSSGANRYGTGGLATNGTSKDTFQGIDGSWIGLTLPNAIRLDHIHMYNRAENTGHVIPAKSGIIWASNDGTLWYRILSFDNLQKTDGALNVLQVNSANFYTRYRVQITANNPDPVKTAVMIGELELYGVPEYDPEADGVDVTVKSLPNVPNTDWLEVYYDAKNYTSGTAVQDESTPQRNGTITTGVTSETVDGIKSFKFAGANNNNIISTAMSLPSGSGAARFSVAVWFKRTLMNTTGLLFTIGDGGADTAPHIYINSSQGMVLDWWSNNVNVLDKLFLTNRWYHLVYTYSGGSHAQGSSIFIDGEPQALGPASNGGSILNLDGSDVLTIGSYPTGSYPFTGNMANFRLFNRALTQDEIYQLYAYQKEYFGHGDLSMTLKAGRLGIGTSEPRAALDVRGDIYGGCPVFFTAYAGDNGTVTGSSTGTVIVFNKTAVNKGGAYDISNGRCTFPVSGYYEVFFRGGTASTVDFHAKIYRNGNAPGSGGWPNNLPRLWDNGDMQYRNAGTIQFFYYFTAGEYIEVRLTDSSVFNADNYNSFSVKYLSN